MTWQDQIAGARMTVDQEFSQRVANSQFSRQQWGLIMTAVEFEVEDADDPDTARIVANTSKLPHVMPELDNLEQSMSAMGAGGGASAGSGGGLVESIKGMLGMGSDAGENSAREEAAAALAQEYATELQAHLEATGRWEQIRTTAAGE